jgi:hypothetical protein
LLPGLQYCNLRGEKSVWYTSRQKYKKAAPISIKLTRSTLYLHNPVNLSANYYIHLPENHNHNKSFMQRLTQRPQILKYRSPDQYRNNHKDRENGKMRKMRDTPRFFYHQTSLPQLLPTIPIQPLRVIFLKLQPRWGDFYSAHNHYETSRNYVSCLPLNKRHQKPFHQKM